MGLIRINLAEIKLFFVDMRSKILLDFNSKIMVGYARHNRHFRKSCAYFKIFQSVEILNCKLSPARVCVQACVFVRVCMCVCFQNLKNSQLHKPTESSGMHGNANDILLRVGYHRKQLEFLWFSWPCRVQLYSKCQWWPLLFEVAFSNIKNYWIINDSQLSIFSLHWQFQA